MWVTEQKDGIPSEVGSDPGSFDFSARYPCAGSNAYTLSNHTQRCWLVVR